MRPKLIKIKVISEYLENLEDAISEWIKAEKIGSIQQSQLHIVKDFATVLIWYSVPGIG